MLNDNDFKKIFFLSNNPIKIADKKAKEILFYEKKFQKNSFDIVYSTETNNEIKIWKNLVLEYVRQNANPKLINSINKVLYIGITSQNNDNTFEMFKLALNYYQNSIIVVNNSNKYYKKIIEKSNSKGKMVVLITNNTEDFKLDYSNLIVYANDNPLQEMYNFSDIILMKESFELENSVFSSKIVYF